MKVIAAIFLVFLTGSAHGEPNDLPRKIYLKEAIEIAFANNNQIRSAGYSAQSASEQFSLTEHPYYPSLTLEESFSISNAPTQAFMMKLDQGRFTQNDFLINNLNNPAAQHDFRTVLSLRQPLYDPAASATVSFARHDAKRAELQHDVSKESIAFQIFKQNLAIIQAVAHQKSADTALKEADENLRLASVRNKVGTGTKSDELRARTDRFSKELDTHTAANNITVARMRLALLLGLKQTDTIEVINFNKLLPADLDRELLLKSALNERKEIHVLHEEIGKSEASARRARSLYYPSVGAFATYQLNSKESPLDNDNTAWAAGINLSWQLFDGFKRNHQNKSAVASQNSVKENLEQIKQEISLQVSEALIRYDEAGKRVYVARHSVADAEETVRLMKIRFENSLATMLELLDAQSILNQTRSNLADAESNQILAAGQVYYSAGIFFKEFIK